MNTDRPGIADWSGSEQDDAPRRSSLRPATLLRSLRRRWLVSALGFAACIGATLAILRVLPRTYHVQTQILARRQQVLPTLARPSLGDESPTAGAFQAIHRRD